jgi:oligoribonuclease NrnB/cAMP/cGMP phosphodiesterase (DHH superfamily)
MVNDDLLTRPTLSDEEWRITPEPDALTPDSIKHEQQSKRFHDAIEQHPAPGESPDVIVLTHGDADGLSSAALLQSLHQNRAVVQTVSYHGAYGYDDALQDLIDARVSHTLLYICDFNPPDRTDATVPEELHTLIKDRYCDVKWFDHHPWDDDVLTAYRNAGVDVVLDTDECTASLIQQDAEDQNVTFPRRLTELVAVTKDIDLWIRDDPRSPRLNVFAGLVDDPSEYVQTVLEHGVDLPADIDAQIDDRIARNERLEHAAVNHAESHKIGEDTTLAVTYTRDGRSSEIGNELTERAGDAVDIAVVLRANVSAGIYSHSDGQGDDPDPTVFARCHEIASTLGGGGHPTASGFPIPVDTFRDLAEYWATAGESVHGQILDAAYHAVRAYEQEQVERNRTDNDL